MKFKALRRKKTKEFVEIQQLSGLNIIFTSELPNPQPMTATIELMKTLYKDCLSEFNFDDFELVEFEMYEADTVGADIRNKLSPPLNLIALLKIYFTPNVAHASEERAKLYEYIKKEMDNAEKNIKYIANLL
jgi:hypothetical protein